MRSTSRQERGCNHANHRASEGQVLYPFPNQCSHLGKLPKTENRFSQMSPWASRRSQNPCHYSTSVVSDTIYSCNATSKSPPVHSVVALTISCYLLAKRSQTVVLTSSATASSTSSSVLSIGSIFPDPSVSCLDFCWVALFWQRYFVLTVSLAAQVVG
jgi:hypothetical protein